MPRAFLFILDSFGIGGAPDAAAFGDEGANTLGHIAERMPLKLPHMASLGLGQAAKLASGRNPLGPATIIGRWGVRDRNLARQGHHHRALGDRRRAAATRDWGYFPHSIPAFPQDLIDALVRALPAAWPSRASAMPRARR